MAVPIITIDGAMPYGTQTILVSNGQTYTLDDFTVTRPVTKATDNKNTGAPNRRRSTAGWITWSGTIQCPSGTNLYPKFGDTFTLTLDDNYGAELFDFDPVNIVQSNDPGAVRKLPVTGNKVYNGSVTTVAAS